MLNKGLEYLQALFAVLADNDYQLGDQEANSFMPYLMIKVCSCTFCFGVIPHMLNKGLEYLQALFAVLADNDYQLGDQEANSFMPYLMIKVCSCTFCFGVIPAC